MTITKRPGVYFNEDVEFELSGDGAKTPVFIGYTGNSGDHIGELQEFEKWSTINTAVENGGLGVYSEDTSNLLLKVLHDFYEEAEITTSDDLGVSKVYVIDLGEAKTKDAWLNAFTTAKSVDDIQLEVYVGFEKATSDSLKVKDLVEAAYASIQTETHALQLRTGFVYVATSADETTQAVDTELIKLTNTSTGNQRSRIGFIEPLLFGKTVARLCVTPYYIEPGFIQYRTIEPTDLINRTPAQEQALEDAGIIFNRVEKTSTEKYCKINLGTSSAFASSPKPADALFHARFNADHLLRKVFDVCYPQIKANEQASNFVKLQTQIDKVVDDEVQLERMIKWNDDTGKGTKLVVSESDSNPYDLYVTGTIQPVNCTIAIEVQATLNTATIKSVS
jgi:hypothetical protein